MVYHIIIILFFCKYIYFLIGGGGGFFSYIICLSAMKHILWQRKSMDRAVEIHGNRKLNLLFTKKKL